MGKQSTELDLKIFQRYSLTSELSKEVKVVENGEEVTKGERENGSIKRGEIWFP